MWIYALFYSVKMATITSLHYVFMTYVFLVTMEIGDCFITKCIDFVSGDIQGGNFSYFNLHHLGLVSLELISHSGDCDLYVSQFKSRPTYEFGSYCSESSSCGLDRIIIPKSFKRPLAVGIYGYPSYEVSTYTLNIYQISDTSEADNEPDELYLTTKYASIEVYDKENSHDPYYLIYKLSAIWKYIVSIWNYLRYIENEYGNRPLFIFDVIQAMIGV